VFSVLLCFVFIHCPLIGTDGHNMGGGANPCFVRGVPPGSREFIAMLPLVCNDAVAILFMFDLSRKSTLISIKEWFRQARGFNKACVARYAPRSRCCCCTLGS
jgi:hypothetical protein